MNPAVNLSHKIRNIKNFMIQTGDPTGKSHSVSRGHNHDVDDFEHM